MGLVAGESEVVVGTAEEGNEGVVDEDEVDRRGTEVVVAAANESVGPDGGNDASKDFEESDVAMETTELHDDDKEPAAAPAPNKDSDLMGDNDLRVDDDDDEEEEEDDDDVLTLAHFPEI